MRIRELGWTLALALATTAGAGCGNGSVGEPCEILGSGEECADDLVCTLTGYTDEEQCVVQAVCLQVCRSSSGCGDGEVCREVLCSEVSSCRGGPPAGAPIGCPSPCSPAP